MRGGISFEGVGYQGATFKAGDGIKALVATANRDAVVGKPVEISAADTVDLGTDGNTVFGFIDSYENDGYCTVQFRGFRTDVSTVDTAPTVGKIVALDGAGKVKDSATTAKLRNPVFISVDATAKTATVFLG
ncbi:MAG: hypothetical protein N2376_01025 [Clostridia bacterium]|nr:hypothetical protein [Clostridia bacterium]